VSPITHPPFTYSKSLPKTVFGERERERERGHWNVKENFSGGNGRGYACMS